MASIILDDTSSNLTCSDSPSLQCNFSSVFSNSWLNGTAVTNANPGPVTLTFSGISAAFYASGILDQTTNATISVDGQQTVALISSFKDPWFSTETLPDGQHNITFAKLQDGFVIDYVLITPGNETSLVGKQLIVDDTDPSLTYTGQWTRNTTALSIDSNWDILNPDSSTYKATSFGGGFQETQDPQASVKFTFIGTSVRVYGFYDLEFPPIIATFAIDGVNQITNYGISSYLAQAHYPWFQSNSELSPGSHILTIKFNSLFSTGGRFTLDYITYTPSFSSLATQLGESSHSTDKHPILIGASVGTVVGILLIAGIVFMLRKRFIAQKTSAIAHLVPDPYRGQVPDNAAASPGSWGPQTMRPIIESRKGEQSAAQGRSDVAQVLPPNRPLPRSSDGLQPAIVNPPATAGPSSTETRANGMNAQAIAELRHIGDEIQQEIRVGGFVVNPPGRNGSPPPRYTEVITRETNTSR